MRHLDSSSGEVVLALVKQVGAVFTLHSRREDDGELYCETRRLDLVSQDTEVAFKYNRVLLRRSQDDVIMTPS